MSKTFNALLDKNYEVTVRRRYEPHTDRRLYVVAARKPGMGSQAEDESFARACMKIARELGVVS